MVFRERFKLILIPGGKLRQFSFFFFLNAAVVFMLSSSVSSARTRDLRSDRVERCFWFQCGFQDSFKHTEAINNEENRRTEKGIINTESH